MANSMRNENMSSSSSSSSSPFESESEELQRLEHTPPFWRNPKKVLSKQLSMCETHRDIAWERRRRQMFMQERRREAAAAAAAAANLDVLCDEDLNELKGCIELGFGFIEEEGAQSLTTTLPALDLYFAVNRLGSPLVSPSSRGSPVPPLGGIGSSSSKSLGVGRSSSASSEDSWKICSPGEDPQQVKTKLRHWAQAVACSVMQSS